MEDYFLLFYFLPAAEVTRFFDQDFTLPITGFGSFWLDIFDSYPAGDVGADTRKAILFIVLRVYISAHLDRKDFLYFLEIRSNLLYSGELL